MVADGSTQSTRLPEAGSVMSRRRVLSGMGGGLVAAAGCASGGGINSSQNGSPKPEPVCSDWEPAPEPTLPEPGEGRTVDLDDERTATVSFVGLLESVRTSTVGSNSHLDVAAPAGVQFVVAAVTYRNDGELMAPSGEDPLAVVVDGTRNPAGRPVFVGAFDWDPAGAMLGFPVPVEPASAAGIVWTGDGATPRWDLPAAVLSDLGRTPRFTVEAFEVPDTARRGYQMPFRLRVANHGDRDGRFLAEFGAEITSDLGEIAFDVPAGETGERCFGVDPSRWFDDTESVPVVLRRGDERWQHRVSVRGAPNGSG